VTTREHLVDHGVPLAPLTTLRLGGPAAKVVEARGDDAVVEAVRACDAAGERVLVLAGGSNVVIADAGFDGTVVRVLTRGVDRDGTALDVAAGEPWDDVVGGAVDAGLAGIECLSGIPGSTGATPIQNVGAYGQDVAQTVTSVRVYDRHKDVVEDLPAEELGFGYRTSALRYQDRRVVLRVRFVPGTQPLDAAPPGVVQPVGLQLPPPDREVRPGDGDLEVLVRPGRAPQVQVDRPARGDVPVHCGISQDGRRLFGSPGVPVLQSRGLALEVTHQPVAGERLVPHDPVRSGLVPLDLDQPVLPFPVPQPFVQAPGVGVVHPDAEAELEVAEPGGVALDRVDERGADAAVLVRRGHLEVGQRRGPAQVLADLRLVGLVAPEVAVADRGRTVPGHEELAPALPLPVEAFGEVVLLPEGRDERRQVTRCGDPDLRHGRNFTLAVRQLQGRSVAGPLGGHRPAARPGDIHNGGIDLAR